MIMQILVFFALAAVSFLVVLDPVRMLPMLFVASVLVSLWFLAGVIV